MQSVEWNPLKTVCNQAAKHPFGDDIRLRQLHTRYRAIPYQAYGLNKKRQISTETCRFFGVSELKYTFTVSSTDSNPAEKEN